MKNRLLPFLILLLMAFPFMSYGQQKHQVQLSHTVRVTVKDIKVMQQKLDHFLQQLPYTPTHYKSNGYLLLHINLDSADWVELHRMVEASGYVTMNDQSSNYVHHDPSINANKIEKLEKEIAEYEQLKSDADKGSDRYFRYAEHLASLKLDLLLLQQEIEQPARKQKVVAYKLSVEEELAPASYYDETWVNMPGVEYSWYRIEQPKTEQTPRIMHGFSLKYLVNTQKTYGIFGIYKSFEEVDENEIDEVYTFGVGQDFYSRHFGRGQYKFFNLYTSFQGGISVATSDVDKQASWFLNPYLGLELLKTKHILLDNKVGYFMPFKDNRNRRGLLYNVSFNFVF